MYRLTKKFSFCRRGATAVEFALLSSAFFLLLFGQIQIGYLLFLQHKLDDATVTAIRAIQLGTVQSNQADTADKFKTSFVCPALGGFFDCSLLVADSRVLSSTNSSFDADAWSKTPVASQAQTSYCVGSAGEYNFLRISYPAETLVGNILPASMFDIYNGKRVMMLQSFGVLRIEPVDVRRTGVCQ